MSSAGSFSDLAVTGNLTVAGMVAGHLCDAGGQGVNLLAADPTIPTDGVTDCAAKIQAVLDAHPGRLILFPKVQPPDAVDYYCAATLSPSGHGAALVGETCGRIKGGTTLRFAPGVPGIRLDVARTVGPSIRHLVLQGSEPYDGNGTVAAQVVFPAGFGGGAAASAADGVQVGAPYTHLENVLVRWFGRHGIAAGAAAFPGGNCDNFTFDRVTALQNRGCGLFWYGGDSSAGETRNAIAFGNHLWGFLDLSFLGNTHYSPQTHANHYDRTAAGPPVALATINRASGVVTATTTVAHHLLPNQCVTVAGVTDTTGTSFNGTFLIASVPDTVTLTFSQAGVDDSGSGGTVNLPRARDAWAAVGADGGPYCSRTTSFPFAYQPAIGNTWIQPYAEEGQSYQATGIGSGSKFNLYDIAIGGDLGAPISPGYTPVLLRCSHVPAGPALNLLLVGNGQDADGRLYFQPGRTTDQNQYLYFLNLANQVLWAIRSSAAAFVLGRGGVAAHPSLTFYPAGDIFLSSDADRMVSLNLIGGTGGTQGGDGQGHVTWAFNGAGDLVRLHGVPYSWPTAQGAPGSVLTNDGTGKLSWLPPA